VINSNLLLGYDPKGSLYKREQTSGNVMWYISYYLPNNKRVQRPVSKNQKEAKKRLKWKKLQLLQGKFDSKDLKKLDGLFSEEKEPKRLSIEEALELYFKVTESRKTANTYYNDLSAINRYFSFFVDSERQFLDEISAFDVQMLVRSLDKSGKSESTIKNSVTMVRKVFNCLIEEVKLYKGENPVPAKIKLPKKNGLVRDRLATDEEIQAILNADKPKVKHSSSISPIKEIISFLIYTGARLSEVLQAEWQDFDLENGIWHIRIKPDCPTKFGLGWSPKWRKSRDVILFQEALNVLGSMPKLKTFGKISKRDEKGKVVDSTFYPSNFVFPKKETKKLPDGSIKIMYTRLDSIKKSWGSLKERAEVHDLQVKDMRTYFNHTLKSKFGFSSKEAGVYIGNSEEVNNLHYTPVSFSQIRTKMGLLNFNEGWKTK
jgi:integrase